MRTARLLAPLLLFACFGKEVVRSSPSDDGEGTSVASSAPREEVAVSSRDDREASLDEARPAPPPPPASHGDKAASKSAAIGEDRAEPLRPERAPAPSKAPSGGMGMGGFETMGRGSSGGLGGTALGAAPSAPAYRPPSSSGVKAGAADDNLQFNAFLEFMATNGTLALPAHDDASRLMVTVRDREGRPLANADVALLDQGARRAGGRTYADGRTLLYPPRGAAQDASLVVRHGGAETRVPLPSGRHTVDVRMGIERPAYERVPLDIAFVLDTTGSMGDEIEQLKATLEVIHFQISNFSPRPDVRFGMVLYKDRGDIYRTQVVPFTSDFEGFRRTLAEVAAGGGGDTPEDVQAALDDTLHKLDWRADGVRLAFLIGDAAPHLDYGQPYDYLDAVRDAAARGIKFATIGASGLPIEGEVVWRQVAQRTMGAFVFLTYGETGDSPGGTPSTVSHHVGANWVAENLDAIVIRMVKLELGHFGQRPTLASEDWFDARHQDGADKEAVLRELFRQSIKQLVDYAVERIDARTPTVVLPPAVKADKLASIAEKLESRLALGLSTAPVFKLVEMKELPAILKALAQQLHDEYDARKTTEAGKLVGARLAVVSRLDEADGRYEMLVKLVRLETAEVLSLSLLKIDGALLR